MTYRGTPGWSTGEEDTINDALRRAAAKWGNRPFLDFEGQITSFAEIDRGARRLANGLAAAGVTKGETVVTILDNHPDAILVWLAINKLGAISVPVNTAYKGEYLRHQVADAGAALLIAEADYAERVASIADRLPALKKLYHRGAKPAAAAPSLTVADFESLRSTNEADAAVEVKAGDLAMLIYTGGTTGPSKGCMVSHNYACNLARQVADICGRSDTSISWTALPLFHLNAVAATVLANLLVGGRVALYSRFSVSSFWPEMERTGANDAMLLGAMVPMLLTAPANEAEKRYFGKLETINGAPFPAPLQDAWKQRFGAKHTIGNGFGLSEGSLMTSLAFGAVAKPNSSGKRNDCFDVRIVDDHDVELPPGEAGEIVVRPLRPHVMFEGYWRRPEETLKLMKNLWFHTGDIGKFDEEGFFYFVDRKKDYLRRRGENISSFEVETSFRRHPAIEDIAAHAVLSSLGEDDLKVTAVLKQGMTVTEEDLCKWSVDELPYFAVPRFIEFRAALPKSPVGRVLKYQLRDEGVTATTWDREKSGLQIKKR